MLNVGKADKIQYDSIVGFLLSGRPSPILQLRGGLMDESSHYRCGLPQIAIYTLLSKKYTCGFWPVLKDRLRGLLVNCTPLEHSQSWGDLPRGPWEKHLKAYTITVSIRQTKKLWKEEGRKGDKSFEPHPYESRRPHTCPRLNTSQKIAKKIPKLSSLADF